MLKTKLVVLCLMITVLVLPGCFRQPAPTAPTQIAEVQKYFPVEPNLTWTYEGTGNEYAAFTRQVLYREGAKVQMSEDNGGTRLGIVLNVTSDAVTRTFVKEEMYSNEKLFSQSANRNEVLLKAPIKVGAVWESGRERREIIRIDETVHVPAGSYSQVVLIKVTYLKDSPAEMLEYYAPNVGLILRQYISGNEKIESRLKSMKQTPI